MLDMNDTGMKMTTREKVVAMTAMPMSAVAARAAANGDHRAAPAPHEGEDDEGSQDASQDQVHVDLVQRGVDVAGLALDHREADARRQLPGGRRDALLAPLAHG